MKAVELLRRKNITLVGRGRKQTAGVNTGQPAIVVGVAEKLPVDEIRSRDLALVPSLMAGMPTDVIETGEIRLMRTSVWRPAMGGISCGHCDITAGTLGMAVWKDGKKYILSNNHVLANVNKGKVGDSILQPGPYDIKGTGDYRIARLSEFVPIRMATESLCPVCSIIVKATNFCCEKLHRKSRLPPAIVSIENLVDCALAKPDNDADLLDTIFEVGEITGITEPEIGMLVKKSGRTTGLTEGEVTIVDATVNVSMGGLDMAIFADQFCCTAYCQGGDSGSIIVDEHNKVVGLLFAGSDTITIGNRISNVEKMLDCSVR